MTAIAAIVVVALGAGLVAPVANARDHAAAASRDRFAYGDSVMVGAKSRLLAKGFRVDAKESRQAYSAPAAMRAKVDRLPRNVVVHMGTNGTFPRSTCDALVRAMGTDHRLFLVTVHAKRSWVAGNNAMIRACAAAHPGVRVVDWNAAASAHPRWLYSDGIHLRAAGAAGYADLIARAVDSAVADDRRLALANASGKGHATILG